MTTEPTPAWLSAAQCAVRYGVTKATIWRWAGNKSGFPRPRRLGSNCSRWKLEELVEWELSLETA